MSRNPNPSNPTEETSKPQAAEAPAPSAEVAQASPEPTRNLSPAEQALRQALKAQDDFAPEPSVDQIRLEVDEWYEDMFRLPRECREGDGLQYDWYWCMVDKDEFLISQAKAKGYKFANKTTTPFLAHHVNHAFGAVTVQREELHVLMFRSRRYREADLERTFRETIGRMQSNPVKSGDELDEYAKEMKFSLNGGYGMTGPGSAPMSFGLDGSSL